MNPEDLIQDIRAYAHAGDQDAGHRVVRALFARRFDELQARWRDVCAYAACLDLDDVARLMRDANYELAHRAIRNARQRRVFLFTPDQIRAIWSPEVPPLAEAHPAALPTVRYFWLEDLSQMAALSAIYKQAYEATRDAGASHRHADTVAMSEVHIADLRAQHRAFVIAIRQRIWMHGGKP